VRDVGLRQRIVLRVVAVAPAVQDQQYDGFGTRTLGWHDGPPDFGQGRIVAKRSSMPFDTIAAGV
jgi:hypothetical protein